MLNPVKKRLMAKSNPTDPAIVNQIMAGTKIKGDIEADENIRIAGRLEGNLTTKGKLAIGKSGIVVGNIRCKNADIEGKVEGKIFVDELLSLKLTSQINGEIKTGKLAIEPGAILNATCDMSGGNLIDGRERTEKKVK